MCTSEALRAPPLRLPALRALVPLMLMMRPHFLLLEERDGRAAHAQRAHELRVEVHAAGRRRSRSRSGRRRGGASGRGAAVDDDMQPTELLGGLFHHAVHLLSARDVGRQGDDTPVGSAESSLAAASRRSLFLEMIATSDSLARQLPRDGFPDAQTAARYDRALAFESQVHLMLLQEVID
jgi:hypothetical protein